MSTRRLDFILWALALPLGVMAGIRAKAESFGSNASTAVATAPAPARRVPAESLARAAAVIVERDPFRLDRRPSSVPYAPVMSEAALPQVARPPKPVLVVTGIVGGPPWEALLEGIPGHSASVVARRGDVLGDSIRRLIVKRVGRDTVVVAGMDTTWTLTVRRAWE